jgi:hypothetical protein
LLALKHIRRIQLGIMQGLPLADANVGVNADVDIDAVDVIDDVNVNDDVAVDINIVVNADVDVNANAVVDANELAALDVTAHIAAPHIAVVHTVVVAIVVITPAAYSIQPPIAVAAILVVDSIQLPLSCTTHIGLVVDYDIVPIIIVVLVVLVVHGAPNMPIVPDALGMHYVHGVPGVPGVPAVLVVHSIVAKRSAVVFVVSSTPLPSGSITLAVASIDPPPPLRFARSIVSAHLHLQLHK